MFITGASTFCHPSKATSFLQLFLLSAPLDRQLLGPSEFDLDYVQTIQQDGKRGESNEYECRFTHADTPHSFSMRSNASGVNRANSAGVKP